MVGWMDGWTDGWLGGWTNGYMNDEFPSVKCPYRATSGLFLGYMNCTKKMNVSFVLSLKTRSYEMLLHAN